MENNGNIQGKACDLMVEINRMLGEAMIDNYKILMKFLGYVYIPFEQKGQKYKGVYSKDIRTLKTSNEKIVNNFYVCRTIRELSFNKDIKILFKLIDVIENKRHAVVEIKTIQIPFDGTEYVMEDVDYEQTPKYHTHYSCKIEDKILGIDVYVKNGDKITAIYFAILEYVKKYNEIVGIENEGSPYSLY